MNYRWKDVYITILPGFLFMLYTILAINLTDCNCIMQWIMKLLYGSKLICILHNDALFVVFVSFISLGIGYLLNGASSLFEHKMYREGCWIYPSIKNQKKDKGTNAMANKNLRNQMHKALVRELSK